MSHDPGNKEGFERWALTQDLNLDLASEERFPRTYRASLTEWAWLGWANRPHRETRVTIAEKWPTPERRTEFNPAFAAPYGQPRKLSDDLAHARAVMEGLAPLEVRIDGGDMTAIREAAARASAEMPEDTDDKTVESCRTRFTHTVSFAGFPKVADTAAFAGHRIFDDGEAVGYVGAVPCENIAKRGIQPEAWRYPVGTHPTTRHWDLCYWRNRPSPGYRQGEEELFAARPLIDAVRALVDRLPRATAPLHCYHARDELLAVRKLLGDD